MIRFRRGLLLACIASGFGCGLIAKLSDFDGASEATPDDDDGGSRADVNGPGAGDDGGKVDADSGGRCVTKFTEGEGRLLFAFDNDVQSWIGAVSALNQSRGIRAQIRHVPNEGHTCPGALELTATLNGDAGGEQTESSRSFTGPLSIWKGTKLHIWIKVVIPSAVSDAGVDATAYQGLNDVSPYLQWANFSQSNLSGRTGGETYANADWHEVVVSLLSDGGVFSRDDVNKVAVQVTTRLALEDGGVVPEPTLIYVDDVWLE